MKKIIFVGLTLLSAQAFGMSYFREHFCSPPVELSNKELVAEAIRNADVKQVLKLVKADNIIQDDLQEYIRISNEHFGLTPQARLKVKIIGYLKLVLGAAAVYKALDYYRKELYGYYREQIEEDSQRTLLSIFGSRYSSAEIHYGHDVILDIASIGGLYSAYKAISDALNTIKPKCDFNSHLLIQLYLKSLVKSKKK